MANYKSEYEKIRKATNEASSLLSVEELITKELRLQTSIREELNGLLKSGKNFLTEKTKIGRSIKSSMERERFVNIATSNKLVKVQEKITSLELRRMGQGPKAGTQAAAQLASLKTQAITLSKQLASARSMAAVKGKILSTWTLIASAMSLALAYFKEFDEEASRFRIRMGFLRQDVEEMEKANFRMWKNTMEFGVTMKDLTGAAESLSESFGSAYTHSDKIRGSVALWQTSLGASTKNSAELLRVFSQLESSTLESQESMGLFLSKATRAAGIPLNETMADIANASKTAYSMMARNPLAIAKAAVEARRLGTTLDSIAKSGKSLLNFTDSINAEMNASVLLGKSINLQRARELAYRRDLQGLNREIVRLARDEVDFNKLDYFQQEAFAAALGKSVDEVSKILQAERQTNWIRANGTMEQKRQLEALEKIDAANKSIQENMSAQADEQLRQRSNQSKISALQASWNKLWFELVEQFVPFVSKMLDVATALVKWITPIAKFVFYLYSAWKVFSAIMGIISFIAGSTITAPLWVVIGAVTALFGLISHFGEIWEAFFGPDGGILKGLKAMGNAMLDTLTWPFRKAYEKISDWLGFSPSKIGLMIVEGLKAVGSMILNNLLRPFKMARWAIRKLFGGKSIVGEAGSPATISAGEEASGAVAGAAATTTTTTTKKRGDVIGLVPTMMGILDSINGLRSDLNEGKVAVYLDSQLVSTHSMRNTLFRKGYGTNKAVAI